jgi:tetratricopeptide (TPR) repeat protein
VSAIHAMNSYVGVEVGRDLLLSLCADLRLLWVEAGGPSLRALERQVSLSKSQVGAILNGRVRRPPDWRVVSTLVECIHRHAVEQGRVDRLSLRTGVEEYWRPRFALLEHAFEETDPQARGTEVGAGRPVVPALLPPAVAGFAGRRDVLAVLDGLLATRAELCPAGLITAIGGTRRPLALAVVAARAAVNPSLSLPRLAAQLRDQAGVLDTLRGGDPTTDVRTVFSWSCRGLPPGAARLFWLLGLHPTAEVGAAAAMSMAGGPPPSARAALGELARVHLITERGPDRYELHDLLRVYAAEQAAAVVSGDHRRAASHRLLDHYVHTAHRASVLLDPHRYLGDAPEEIEPGVTPEDIVDTGHALRWFTTEHRTLLAAVEHAAEAGFPRHAWQLARAMNVYLYRQGHYHDLTASHRTALAAAKRAGDLTGQAHALRGIAAADGAVGRFRETRVSLEAALELFSQTGDHDGTGVIHENLGMLAAYTGDPGEALPHMRRSFELHQSTGRLAGQARALSSLGRCQAQLGDSVQAIHACEQALVMQRRLGDTYGIAYTWDSLGLAYAAAGDHHESARCHHRALELFRITGHRACQANEWDRIGDAQHAAGNIDAAKVAWCEAVTINDSIALSDAAGIRAKLLRHGVVLEADDLSD